MTEIISMGHTADGEPLSKERLENLAALIGHPIAQGHVARVMLVFVFGPSDAEPWLPDLRRLGLGCQVVDPANGEVRTVVGGMATAAAPDTDSSGVLLPALREREAPRITLYARRPLFGDAPVHGPWVTFGHDTGAALRPISVESLDQDLAQLEADAVVHLRSMTPPVVRDFSEGILAVEGHYAAELLLLVPEFSLALEDTLGGNGVVIAAPTSENLLVGSMDDLARGVALSRWCRERFDAAQSRRIHPLPFIVQRGALVGVMER